MSIFARGHTLQDYVVGQSDLIPYYCCGKSISNRSWRTHRGCCRQQALQFMRPSSLTLSSARSPLHDSSLWLWLCGGDGDKRMREPALCTPKSLHEKLLLFFNSLIFSWSLIEVESPIDPSENEVFVCLTGRKDDACDLTIFIEVISYLGDDTIYIWPSS
jgi:hypothetical protein